MREPKTFSALFLLAASACEPSQPPPPAAPAAVVPVASASGAPLAVEPAPPPAPTTEPDPDAPPADLASRSEPNDFIPPPQPSAGGGGPPFDRGHAAAALGAVNIQSCATANGPRGTGHVKLTFATNGYVRAAVLDQGPFVATAAGNCILSRFRTVRVPPFAGNEVSVGKSFTLR